MARATVKTFAEVLTQTVYAEAADGVLEQKKRLESSVRKIVKDANRYYFSMMANQAFNKSGPPNLGKYTPSWKLLNDRYVEWKRRRGKSTKFYQLEGDLKSEMKAMDPSLLGDPEISYSKGGFVLRPGVSRTPAGRFRGAGGRFVSAANAQVFRPSTLSIDVAPDIESPWDLFDDDEELAAKLSNWRGREYRPIVEPWMRWWIDIHIRGKIERFLKK